MAGRLLLSGLSIKLYLEEEHFLSFVVGSALLSTFVFLLTAAHLAYLGVFLAVGTVIILAGVWRGKLATERFEPLSLVWKLLFIVPYAAFGVIYLALAFGPEVSPDGTAYRVGLVARYYYAYSFLRITTSMFASFSQGIEVQAAFDGNLLTLWSTREAYKSDHRTLRVHIQFEQAHPNTNASIRLEMKTGIGNGIVKPPLSSGATGSRLLCRDGDA